MQWAESGEVSTRSWRAEPRPVVAFEKKNRFPHWLVPVIISLSFCVTPSLTVQSTGLIDVPVKGKEKLGSAHSYFTMPKSSVEPSPESWNGWCPSTVEGLMAIFATGGAPTLTTT